MQVTPFPLLQPASTIDDVVERTDAVVTWSIANESRLGYFAALYKRITRAVAAGITAGRFEDGPRMERLDTIFANRYFAALNGAFAPASYPAPLQAWHVAFDGAQRPGPCIIQHMLASVNAHIKLDLGIAAAQVAHPAPLAALKRDFDTINAVLAEQVHVVLDEIDRISPLLADLYDVLQKYEVDAIGEGLVGVRDEAWRFATVLELEPDPLRAPTIATHDLAVAVAGTQVLDPVVPPPAVLAALNAAESRDVANNVRILDGIASTPVRAPATAPSVSAEA